MHQQQDQSPAWVVSGPPGAGKSTVASLLLARLTPIPALLDKDTMYGDFVSAVLARAGRPYGEREGPWYDEHIKVHEYKGMAAVAAQIRTHGCPVLLAAPFTQQIHDPMQWASFTAALGGGVIHLVWIRSDVTTVQERLARRDLARDSEKMRRFDEFLDGMRINDPPIVPHLLVDNRLSCAEPLDTQVARIANS